MPFGGVKRWMARQAYSALLRLGTPAYLARIGSRGRQEPLYRLDWPQRLGLYGRAYRQGWRQGPGAHAGPLVWLHAVSLGEARAAAPLVQALRAERPDMRLLLTHGTATGRDAGKALLQPGDVQTWFPYDTPGAVRRFLRQHRPHVGVLMETEVWPNVQHEAHRIGVPMVLANARLSEKSLRQGLGLASLMRPAAERMALCLAQTEADAQRLRTMGGGEVRVCGNVKFDMTPSDALLEQGRAWAAASGRPIVLAASTREGEEPGLLEAWEALQVARAGADADAAQVSVEQGVQATVGKRAQGTLAPRLWIVPRHPQRFDEVAALIAQRGWTLSRRSGWPYGMPDETALKADVWLGDSMGEMPAYYAAASVALLGGSFAPLGGQNLIEAAACGCPVVMGPSTFNFAEAATLSEEAGAAMRVPAWPEGIELARRLCASSERDDRSRAALAFARAHRGAAQRMARAIWDLAGRTALKPR